MNKWDTNHAQQVAPYLPIELYQKNIYINNSRKKKKWKHICCLIQILLSERNERFASVILEETLCVVSLCVYDKQLFVL